MSKVTPDAPRTLDAPPVRELNLLDQLGLWGNLGISLLGFAGALVVLQPLGPGTPQMGLGPAVLALVAGTLVGIAGVGVMAYAGSRSGQPAMVLLRGLLGGRLSYVPTVLNVAQLVGWGTFEIVTMSTALRTVWHVPSVPVTLLIGVGATALAWYPLRWVKVLRKYVTVAVALSMAYLAVRLGTTAIPAHHAGGWHGFAVAMDAIIALSLSWVPLAGDYARHSTSDRAAVTGCVVGYSVTQIACYGIGIAAVLLVAGDTDRVFAAFLAIPLGALCFLVLALREIDQCFVDVYSSTMSVQNLAPRLDRRVISLATGGLMTVLALSVDIYGYAAFLGLIGSVFAPLLGVFVVDYLVLGGHRNWNTAADAPSRPSRLIPWGVGFVAYNMVNPGELGWWSRWWERVDDALHFTSPTWLPGTLGAFAVAAVVTLLIGLVERRRSVPTQG